MAGSALHTLLAMDLDRSKNQERTHVSPPARAALVAFSPLSTAVRPSAEGAAPEKSDWATWRMPPCAVLTPAAAASWTVGSWISPTALFVSPRALTIWKRATLHAMED